MVNHTSLPQGDAQTMSYILLAAVILLSLSLAWLLNRFVVAALRKLVARTKSDWDDVILESVRRPLVLILAIVGTGIGLHRYEASLPRAAIEMADRFNFVIFVLAFAYAIARVSSAFLRRRGQTRKRLRGLTNLGARLIHLVVYVMAGLLVLDTYGISITPILTSLGIAGLAVALALQDTLSNLFAGMWIQTGRAMQPGHYVRLEGQGVEGFIEEVGWRSTSIRTVPNNLVIVPNAKLVQTIVTDHDMPEPRMGHTIRVGVGYESDPAHVERVLLDVVKSAVGQVHGLLGEPGPIVRFHPGFGDFTLDFTLIFQVGSFNDQFLVQSELRKRILARFREEGIRIPFPIRETYQVPPTRADVAQ